MSARFWQRHLLVPAILLLGAFLFLQWTHLDIALVDAFYDPVGHRFPAEHGFWAHDVMHAGGKRFVYVVAAGWLAVLLAGWWPATRARWGMWRRAAVYVLACMLVTPAIVGSLKAVSDTPCPVYLQRYGGRYPESPLLGPAAVDLPGSGCFPGAHSSAAFSLFALYFVYRRRRPRLAGALLAGVVLLGAAYSFAQSARGSHFLSHDVVSAAIGWAVALGLYLWPWRAQLLPGDDPPTTR